MLFRSDVVAVTDTVNSGVDCNSNASGSPALAALIREWEQLDGERSSRWQEESGAPALLLHRGCDPLHYRWVCNYTVTLGEK